MRRAIVLLVLGAALSGCVAPPLDLWWRMDAESRICHMKAYVQNGGIPAQFGDGHCESLE